VEFRQKLCPGTVFSVSKHEREKVDKERRGTEESKKVLKNVRKWEVGGSRYEKALEGCRCVWDVSLWIFVSVLKKYWTKFLDLEMDDRIKPGLSLISRTSTCTAGKY